MRTTSFSPDVPVRFSVLHRFLHLVVMFGFTGLAITGLSLGLSSTAPARGFMWLIGGAAHGAWLHRCCAIFTYGCVVIHGLWFLYFKFGLAGAWTGPDSIFPSGKDVSDFKCHLAYFLGRKGSPPVFNKFSYMEKIEYWALFIGMNTMGITGLILWFPECVTRYLPGFWVNIAQVLHFYEAILAVVVKGFIHIGMAHFRPGVYPADTSIFTGRSHAETAGAVDAGRYSNDMTAREEG
jgi:cytochrome b subunit of formate dehydrogenase